MKTEKEIQQKLKADLTQRKIIQKRFNKYDNIDDMHALEEYDASIKTLEWVLGTE